MASKVYTFRIASLFGNTKSEIYTVPDQKRVVVTNIFGRVDAAVDGWVFVYVHGNPIYLHHFQVAYAVNSETCRLVAYERETIQSIISGTDVELVVTGYIFDDFEGRPPAGDVEHSNDPSEWPAPAGEIAAGA